MTIADSVKQAYSDVVLLKAFCIEHKVDFKQNEDGTVLTVKDNVGFTFNTKQRRYSQKNGTKADDYFNIVACATKLHSINL